jgi:group I intron endonuclease
MNDAPLVFGEVYVHTCTANEKSYVGQTTQGMAKRWREHVRHSRSPKCVDFRYPFARAIRKYGPEAFEHQILAIARSKAELDNLEKVWIILLNTRENGYNLGAGGEGNPGLSHTEESKAKISKNRKGKNLGNRNAAGTVQTPAMRQRKSEANMGCVFSQEHNEKIRRARTGVKRPDVTAWNNRRWSNPEAHVRASELATAQRAREIAEKANG